MEQLVVTTQERLDELIAEFVEYQSDFELSAPIRLPAFIFWSKELDGMDSPKILYTWFTAHELLDVIKEMGQSTTSN